MTSPAGHSSLATDFVPELSPRRIRHLSAPRRSTGFETTLQYRVGDGHDEVSATSRSGGGSGKHGQFQVQADVGQAAFQLDRLIVQAFEISPRDVSEISLVSVPVIYGPRIVRANPDQETDPDVIVPGQVLRIPIGA
ncbi:LysM peptidoglycan-binding domain-containing protein [Streptomyces chrestomyceticus]|uniref:LysM peptidoglycan-binding domain-containing protein n=1 Tax=Streptomyces chrestomyceticus TaxID=68185 RepID=UPI0033F299AB